jgi:hypothetical protein
MFYKRLLINGFNRILSCQTLMQDSQAPVLTVSILLKIDTLMHLYHALTQSLNFVKNTNLILDSDYKLVSYKVKII